MLQAASSSGDVEDTWLDDDNLFVVNEAAAQSYTIDFTFGDGGDPVPTDQITANLAGFYDGNPAHDVKLKQWNYETSGWDDVTADGAELRVSAASVRHEQHLRQRR